MRTPAAAIGWEFLQHHRWGLIAILATILALGVIKIAVLATGAQLEFTEVTFALLIAVPFAAAFFFLLAVFTFGTSGDLAARESMFPPRMLILPVSSAALAGWPMLYGCGSMVLLWIAMRIVGVFPPAAGVPKYWPALFAASLLAWAQALTWMPYPFRGMRILTSIGLLLSIDLVAITALEIEVRESTMLVLFAPLVPLAYVAARAAISRARRGEVPEWGRRASRASASTRSAAPRDFRSSARALFWFEWRQFGRSLPLLVAIVLLPALSLLFVFREAGVLVIEIVAISLLVPSFMAVFVAATAGKSSSNASESYGITPFIATRPVEDHALVIAKWKAALLSTLMTWGIVLVLVSAVLEWAGATEPITNIARSVDDALGPPRAITLGLLVLAGLVASTWKQLVQGLYVTMSGRDWAVKGIAFATLAAVTVGFFAFGWIVDSRYRIVLAWNAIPWVLVVLVTLKLGLAWRVMQRAFRGGVFTRAQLILAAIAWDACVLAVYGTLAFVLPAILARRHYLLLVAILVVPFVRLAATPLAVARNRHR